MSFEVAGGGAKQGGGVCFVELHSLASVVSVSIKCMSPIKYCILLKFKLAFHFNVDTEEKDLPSNVPKAPPQKRGATAKASPSIKKRGKRKASQSRQKHGTRSDRGFLASSLLIHIWKNNSVQRRR